MHVCAEEDTLYYETYQEKDVAEAYETLASLGHQNLLIGFIFTFFSGL